jgi:hypothetical protein
MPARLRLLLLLLLAAAAAAPASALLGETLSDLKKRFGPPEVQMEVRKDNAYWLFEGDDGQLMYSVTFNAKGHSMAEGLKPLKRARFGKTRVMEFIDSELIPAQGSPTLRVMKTGETFHFAGQTMTCGASEYVAVDERLGILVVWNQTGVPSVLVLSPEMLSGGSK